MKKEIEETNYVKLSDTDSLFIEIGSILKHMVNQGIEINNNNKDQIILKIAKKIQNRSNENLENICSNFFNLKQNKYYQLKQEVIVKSLLVTGKRRYGMWITNKEGVEVDELNLKGLEVMKSNTNQIFKKFGEEFIKSLLFNTPKPQLDKSIIDFYKQIKNADPKLIGKPSGVSFINKCIKNPPRAGSIFSELNLNTKENSKAAIYYNDLLKFKGLDTKYESIIEGDKIYVFNLVKNPYNVGVIGYPQQKVPPEIDDFIRKYIDYEKIFESSILDKLKELYKDLNYDFPSLNSNFNKFFKIKT